MANCIPEQKVSQAPYDVWVLLEKGSGKIYSADCNCPAGVSGCCKHIGALLWHIESEVKLGKNVTCTGKAQEWHKPSKKLAKVYGPAFLIDINATKPQIKDSLLPIKKEISNRATFDSRYKIRIRRYNFKWSQILQGLGGVISSGVKFIHINKKRATSEVQDEISHHRYPIHFELGMSIFNIKFRF